MYFLFVNDNDDDDDHHHHHDDHDDDNHANNFRSPSASHMSEPLNSQMCYCKMITTLTTNTDLR